MKISEEAKQLHFEAHVIDLHVDSLLLTRQFGYDINKRHRAWLPGGAIGSHADLPRMREGGVDTVGFGIVVNPLAKPFNRWQSALYMSDLFKKASRNSAGMLRLAGDAQEARALKKDGKFGAFLGMEGAHCLGDDLYNVKEARDVGVRYITLTHFSENSAAYPAKGKGSDPDAGLKKWGYELIDEMKRLGLLIDLAHINRKGFLEAVAYANTPCVVTHSGVRGVQEHWRNLDDDQLRAIGNCGGVVGVIFDPRYIAPGMSCGAERVVEHLQYIINVAGEDCAAIGSDFDGYISGTPRGLRDAADLPVLTQIMLDKGWQEKRIRKVLGENFLRVFNF